MKPSKLYLKIFLYFVMILIVTELLIFGLFIVTAGRIFQARFEHYTRAKVLVAREFVNEKIQSEPERHPAENESLKNLILFFSKTYDAKVWLASADGTTVVKSFPGSLPIEISKITLQEDAHRPDLKNYRHLKKDWMSYSVIPVQIGKDQMGSLHIIFETAEADHIKAVFAIGLAAIGLIVALLVYSVSRRITAPIKKLKDSTLLIAKGDLSHRAVVKSRDEIGDLSRSFNFMTEKLEKMIRGSRELIAHVSHEIRSPLARIRVSEELLKDCIERSDYTDLKRHLNTMEQDIEELDRLIESLLTLSKLDIQETALKLDSIDLTALINDLLNRLKPGINRKNLKVQTSLSIDQPIVGDKAALKTAFSNILENTVKFTPENGQVIIKMYFQEKFSVITVTNSFGALSEKDLFQIFEPFYRTEQTRTTGSGLGLSITKKIIEKHRGSISAENSPDGFKILISLPAIDLKG
ncbi:MAG: HAMP domain-containing histidine kinase [Desulfobacterales bacterium]|nr:HAMP domain-containing histidine kinase [Desulfobacterales bacterium]